MIVEITTQFRVFAKEPARFRRNGIHFQLQSRDSNDNLNLNNSSHFTVSQKNFTVVSGFVCFLSVSMLCVRFMGFPCFARPLLTLLELFADD